MRQLSKDELSFVSGGTNPHLTTVSVTTNPGGVVPKHRPIPSVHPRHLRFKKGTIALLRRRKATDD